MSCFIDASQPTTPAERAAWRLYLTLPPPYLKHARALFRRGHDGLEPGLNVFMFEAESDSSDPHMRAALDKVLRGLATEMQQPIKIGIPMTKKPSAVEVLTACQDGDIVYIDWPDGSDTVVKGEAFLNDIIITGAARKATIFRIPVASETEAEIIAAVIKVIEDGDFHIGAEAAFCRLLHEVRVGIR